MERLYRGDAEWLTSTTFEKAPEHRRGIPSCAQGSTHLNFNSGLFYIQANERTIDLMTRIATRLSKEKAWDQVCDTLIASFGLLMPLASVSSSKPFAFCTPIGLLGRAT